MSSEYRSRHSGPGRGRGRRQGGRSGERRHSTVSVPVKIAEKSNPIKKLFGWLLKPKTKTAHASSRTHADGESRSRPQRSASAPPADETPQEITSPKLYVGNLAYEAVESDLFDLFSKVGEVKNVEVVKDRHSNRSKGFGFVEMELLESAKAAADQLNRTDFLGRQIVVSGAKTDRR